MKLSFSGPGKRKRARRDGDQWLAERRDSEEQSSGPVSLYISRFGRKQEEREGMAVLSLIGFDFGGTQLPADRTFPVQVSVPPAGSAKMIAAHITEAAGRRLSESFPLENMRGQIGNWFCITCQ